MRDANTNRYTDPEAPLISHNPRTELPYTAYTDYCDTPCCHCHPSIATGMPTVKLPHDSNVTLKPPSPPHDSAHQQRFGLRTTHINFALATIVLISLVRLAIWRFSFQLPSWAQGPWQSARRKPKVTKDSKSYSRVSSAPTAPTYTHPKPPLWGLLGCDEAAQTVWAAGLLASSPTDQARTGLTASALGMEAQRARTGSRGVSTSDAGPRHPVSSSRADSGSRKSSRSPRSHDPRPSPRRHSSSSDGSARAQHKGKGLMHGDSWVVGTPNEDAEAGSVPGGTQGAMSVPAGERAGYERLTSSSTSPFSRPVPPPPLTPPAPYAGVFALEDRRPRYAVSIPARLDASFIHQPNPDYMSSSSSISAESHQEPNPRSSAATPRRRSYTKSVPIGITMPSGSSSSSSHQSHDGAWGMSSTDTFSSASYPPSSPQLPPPPPGSYDVVIYDYDDRRQEEIDLQGEIISVMDDAGHGWKRHTRVYGGGVCLACVAAGERQGGFYGDKVPLSERR